MRLTFAALAILTFNCSASAQDLAAPTAATLPSFRASLSSMVDLTSVSDTQRAGWLKTLRDLAAAAPPTDFAAQNDIWGSITLLDPSSAEARIKAETFATIAGSSVAVAPTAPTAELGEPEPPVLATPEDEARLAMKNSFVSESIRRTLSQQDFDAAKRNIEAQGPRASWPFGLAEAMEAAALDIVRPLPASNATANAGGYEILSLIMPENQIYQDKAASYRQAEIEARSGVVKALKKEHDKVRGINFFHHRGEPRYADTRSTIWLYISQSDRGGKPTLHVRGNYTSDSWLFASSLEVYIDGKTMPFYRGEFLRDNDTEIWEWFDEVPTADQIGLLRKIADSKEVILRFTGQTYYDDATIGASDKRAISDMLAAYETMSEG